MNIELIGILNIKKGKCKCNYTKVEQIYFQLFPVIFLQVRRPEQKVQTNNRSIIQLRKNNDNIAHS